jgi:hypothetical protein
VKSATPDHFVLFPRLMRIAAIVLLLSGVLSPLHLAAKDLTLPTLTALQDSLKKTGAGMFKGQDPVKLQANQKFLAFLKQALEMEGAFDFAFDSLPFIARLDAPDKAFRIFNWNIPLNDGTHQYYGYILVDQEKIEDQKKKSKGSKLRSSNRYVLYTLTDQSDFIRSPELATLNCDKWFGCLYYKVILTSHKKKNYYTLLGWDGNNPITWKKVIEVMTFAKDGQPVFGEEMLIQVNKLSKRRVIFEFKAELTMTLKYEERNKRIVCDVLAPEVSGAEGMRQFYVNTGAYDAYVWKKGKWLYKPDQDIRNTKDKKDDKYIPPDN